MRNKEVSRKKNILSVRITDREMEHVQELMETARLSASELIREALLAYASSWETKGGAESVRGARAGVWGTAGLLRERRALRELSMERRSLPVPGLK